VRLFPPTACVFFVYDLFLSGQPNLGLLALVLGGLLLARAGRGWWAGVPLAAAAALKAFPVVVLVYLLWRREWKAAGSMVLGLVFFLFVLPVPVRGWDRNLTDLSEWANGMLFSRGDEGPGQRPERSLGWRNQSLQGVTSRLVRAGNAKAEETAEEIDDRNRVTAAVTGTAAPTAAALQPGSRGHPLFVNVIDLGPRGGALAGVAFAGVLGLGFVLVLPRRAARTARTDAVEFALLVTLVTVASPYSYAYYFAWMITPLTVLVHFALTAATRADRRVAWATTAGTVVLFAAYPVQVWGLIPASLGALFWSAVVALAGLGYLMVRERSRPS
jgi:Glycosyltransferase family 87